MNGAWPGVGYVLPRIPPSAGRLEAYAPSHIQILYVQRVVLDELAAAFHVFAH